MSLTRRSLMALAGFGLSIGLLVLIPTARQALFARFVSPVLDTVEIGDFFRLKVDVDYRGTPMPFDIVVSCNLRITRYRDFSRSVEASGLTPTLFGRVSLDGKKTVAVRPPVFCRGETTDNGQVPANFMPLMVVFPSTEWFDFAIAYVQDEAYESPLSDLKFHSATVHKATYDEFVAFRKAQPNAINVFASGPSMDKPPEVWKSMVNYSHPQQLRHINSCRFWTRSHLAPAAQSEIQKYWPLTKPAFWTAELGRIPSGFSDIARRDRYADSEDASSQLISGTSSDYDIADFVPDQGVVRRDGTGVPRPRGYVSPNLAPIAVYPDAQMWTVAGQPNDPVGVGRARKLEGVRYVTNIDLRPEARGFAYCWPDAESFLFRIALFDGAHAGRPLDEKQRMELSAAIWRMKFIQHANGDPVMMACLNGTAKVLPDRCNINAINVEHGVLFERDSYRLSRVSFDLGVLKGKL